MSYGWIYELEEASIPLMQAIENIQSDDAGGWREGSANAIEHVDMALHSVGLSYDELARVVKAIRGVLENEL